MPRWRRKRIARVRKHEQQAREREAVQLDVSIKRMERKIDRAIAATKNER